MGCYIDSEERMFTDTPTRINAMTHESCRAQCGGYMYFGLQVHLFSNFELPKNLLLVSAFQSVYLCVVPIALYGANE